VGLASVFAGAMSAITLMAQATPSPPPAPDQHATPVQSPYAFAGDAAMTLNFIKPDKAADFEMIVAKLKEALQRSTNPERLQQAASWKVYKADEPGPNGSSIYVFVIDPVVKDSDYTVSRILSEGFPQDVLPLYKTLADAYVSQNILNLSLLSDLGQ